MADFSSANIRVIKRLMVNYDIPRQYEESFELLSGQESRDKQTLQPLRVRPLDLVL